MATNKDLLKSWFETDKKPTQEQFAAWMDSYFHKDEMIPAASIEGLQKVIDDIQKDANNIANEVLLNRTFIISMERTEQTLGFGEDMIINKAMCHNVSKLEIKPTTSDVWIDIPQSEDVVIELSADVFSYTLRVTPIEDLMNCLVYIMAKVKAK